MRAEHPMSRTTPRDMKRPLIMDYLQNPGNASKSSRMIAEELNQSGVHVGKDLVERCRREHFGESDDFARMGADGKSRRSARRRHVARRAKYLVEVLVGEESVFEHEFDQPIILPAAGDSLSVEISGMACPKFYGQELVVESRKILFIGDGDVKVEHVQLYCRKQDQERDNDRQ